MANVAPKIIAVVGKGVSALNPVLAVVQTLVSIYEVIKPDEKIDEIGDRAIQAADVKDIKMHDFEDFDEYMEELRNFELDPDKSARIDTLTKQLTGMAIVTSGLADKLDTDINTLGDIWLLPASNPEYFNADRLSAILDKTTDVASVIKYFDSSLTPASALKVESEIVSAEKSLYPEKSESEIFKQLDDAQEKLKDIGSKIEQ
ncbi:MAG: hypothetical protein COA47_15935 [Robiginitomaculum sp.]|nr:MAG: hypothetical protein COA47_15935 [Robiginitomaculum sp.]